MAISTYQELSWDNSQSFYLSQVWSLYCRQIDWDWQLCNLGYYGYADPRFENGDPSPDILAFHPQGDVQHIHIECFQDYDSPSDENTDKSQISEVITNISESKSVSDQTVTTYLSKRDDHDFTPTTQEVVCVLSSEIYEEYSADINREVKEKDIILWLIEPNGKTAIWKETGSHSNLTLDDEISNRLKAYPSSNDLLKYTRSTDRDRLKYEFIQRLSRHCGRMNQLSFAFEEADEIMVSTHPPILGHLPEEVRKEEYWADFLWTMLNRLDLLKQSEEEPDRYRWTEKRFIREPRHRHKILSRVQSFLGLAREGRK